MLIQQIVKTASGVSVIGLVYAVTLVAVLAPVQATDIAWHSTSELTYDSPPNYRREGTAVFKTGQKAGLALSGTYDIIDDKGTRPFKGQFLLRFDDGSTISIQLAGSNTADGVQSGSGSFMSGTGRFKGIRGTVTLVGRLSGSMSESDWVGSYSLPGR